ncbi:hypothetical protein CU669_02860 [Paramagnetospirillum kuznetsovii]|uniref:Uncharacterized protein n=1 Tax=Paramagnetospirillum kuznetsovii TaxID=2053833 RepID=A0A364P1A9_9PROT|nr:hypothetical protein [Paramagnetospirillum kuznetsovii]RAU23122.1 hypothetical protein CU669_02860 [Paramagnetospirillum kuznetsovii]
MIRRLAMLTCLFAFPALGGEISCPDMSSAVQVGQCPSEQELKWGYDGYCGDNARLYDKSNPDGDTCVSMDNYRKLKDVALWEAGEFHGYLHCSRPVEQHKSAKLVQLGVGKIGSMTRVVCSYDGGDDMTLRLRADCVAKDGKAVCKD